jgi:predicted nucleic acid-binding Zn ribbon protein
MNCPECGKPIRPDQNFCRECGKELLASSPSRTQAAGVGVLAMIFVGLLVAIFGKMFEMKWLAYLGLVILFTGAFIIAAYGLMRETRPRRRKSAHQTKNATQYQPENSAQLESERADMTTPQSIEKADTTNKLLPPTDPDYIPSVVEDTTHLLKTPAKRPRSA